MQTFRGALMAAVRVRLDSDSASCVRAQSGEVLVGSVQAGHTLLKGPGRRHDGWFVGSDDSLESKPAQE